MLKRLSIKDYALLRNIEIEFKPGLTAITGETGSGKSLLIEALNFLGGAKSSAGMIRDGAKTAVIEAEFEDNKGQVAILRRELHQSGRSRVFLDDSPTTQKDMIQAASNLIDITSQRAFSHLLDPSKHLDFLDIYCGLMKEREALAGFQVQYAQINKEIYRLEKKLHEYTQNKDLTLFQLKQIDSVDPREGEEEELKAEINRLEHYEDLYRYGGDFVLLMKDGDGCVDASISQAQRLLDKITELDGELAEFKGELDSAKAALKEITRNVEDRCLKAEFNPEELEGLREREHAISGLIKKYGGSFNALIEYREKLINSLNEQDNSSEALKTLKGKRAEIVRDWTKLALSVSKIRKKKKQFFEKAIIDSLQKLGIKKAHFIAEIFKTQQTDGLYKEEGNNYLLNHRGLEDVEFFFSANPGLEPRPLSKIASGGELSRILLSIKESLPALEREAAIIFDEIDTGVSGKAAYLVGSKLKELARDRQMIAITHLPQIAGLADQHYRVCKMQVGEKTESVIEEVTGSARIDEIASMLSGGKITGAAIDQAKYLIETGREINLNDG